MTEATEAADDAIRVVDNPTEHRYEIWDGDVLAGFAEYVHRDERVVFTHTEIADAFEGRGLAGRLARVALDDVIGLGLQITPQCPYIASWIRRHPDYLASVDPDHRYLVDKARD